MRRSIKFGLLSLLLTLGTAPVRADLVNNDIKTVEMLRSKAIQAQLEGNPGDALDDYELALAPAKKAFGETAPVLSEIYYDMGTLSLSTSKFDKAEKYLNLALKLNPNSSAAHLRLAELRLLQSRFVAQPLQYARAEDAANHAAAVLAKHEGDVVAHKELALAFEMHDDGRKAYNEYSAVDKLIQGLPVKIAVPVFKPKQDDATAHKAADDAQKAQKAQQDNKKKAEKDAADAKKKAEQDKAEAKKKADLDKKNGAAAAAKKKADESKKKGDQDKKNAAAAEAKRKAAEKKASEKKKAVPAPTPTVAGEGGLAATLSSKAVLLTPLKKKAAAAAEAKKAEEKKAAAENAEAPDEDETPKKVAPAKKAAPAKPVEEAAPKPVAPKPGKHAPGLVPPPPPVMTSYPVMPPPQAVAVPKPKPPAPKKEEKPKEQPAAKEDTPAADKGEEGDFLLDWGGAKAKKKK